MVASASSMSWVMPPSTSPMKASVMWKFSDGTQLASGTPPCIALRVSATSSGIGNATKRRGMARALPHDAAQPHDGDARPHLVVGRHHQHAIVVGRMHGLAVVVADQGA